MVTPRDIKVVLATAVVVAAAMGTTRAQTQVLGSRIFLWDSLKVEKTNVGERRDVVRSPTATLDELEMHITTLNAGQQSHAPHQHLGRGADHHQGGDARVAASTANTAASARARSCSRPPTSSTASEHRHRSRHLSRDPVAIAGMLKK